MISSTKKDKDRPCNDDEEGVLLEFFRQATAALDGCPDTSQPLSNTAVTLADLRQGIRSHQEACLLLTAGTEDAVAQLRARLRDCGQRPHRYTVPVQQAMAQLHQAARSALCRSVLYIESSPASNGGEKKKHRHTNGVKIAEADLWEFIGLVSAAVRIPQVQQYVHEGTPLYGIAQQRSSDGSHERLVHLQRLFLQALGYDPDPAMQEIERLLDSSPSMDPPLLAAMQAMQQEMEQFLSRATATHFPDDEVTRIVSVTHSEKIIDAVTGQEIATLDDHSGAEDPYHAPQALHMAAVERDLDHAPHAPAVLLATHALEQEILGELLSLRDEVRDERLRQAAAVLDELRRLPDPAARWERLRQLDPTTQRHLAMKKLWDQLVAANGMEEPVIRHNSHWNIDASSP